MASKKVKYIMPMVLGVVGFCLLSGFSIFQWGKLLEKDEYVAWADENKADFYVSKEIASVKYGAQFEPTGVSQLKSMRSAGATSADNHAATQDLWQFQFQFADVNGGEALHIGLTGKEEYDRRIKYLAFEAQKDFKLVIDKQDTVPCAFAHFERTFGVQPHVTVNLAFPKQEGKQVTMLYKDGLFHKGYVKLAFPKNMINKQAQLDI